MMLGMICMLIANRGIFIHTHVLADGSIIAHSHPYDKSENAGSSQPHPHTSIEIFFLDNLNILFLTLFAAFFPGIFSKSPGYRCQVVSFLPSPIYDPNQGRAPPIASLSSPRFSEDH